jgi:hypothetical protein
VLAGKNIFVGLFSNGIFYLHAAYFVGLKTYVADAAAISRPESHFRGLNCFSLWLLSPKYPLLMFYHSQTCRHVMK